MIFAKVIRKTVSWLEKRKNKIANLDRQILSIERSVYKLGVLGVLFSLIFVLAAALLLKIFFGSIMAAYVSYLFWGKNFVWPGLSLLGLFWDTVFLVIIGLIFLTTMFYEKIGILSMRISKIVQEAMEDILHQEIVEFEKLRLIRKSEIAGFWKKNYLTMRHISGFYPGLFQKKLLASLLMVIQFELNCFVNISGVYVLGLFLGTFVILFLQV